MAPARRPALTTPTVDLVVGDFDPTPSRLISQFRGRGAGLRVGRGIWALGGRYLETPHQSGRRIEERAVLGELEVGGQAARLQYVERSEPTTSEHSELLDFEALFRPLQTLALRLGLAHGRRTGGSTEATAGLGGELEILGERKRWSYNVRGVMVRLGGAVARTDENGEFRIAALATGNHPVVMDTARLGYRMLPSALNPQVVAVVGGTNEPLDLWLTSAGVVRGTIAREPSETERWAATDRSLLTAEPDVLLPVAGALVELSDGLTTLRRLTYADGRFVFDPLRPGTWTLRLVGSPPAGYVARYADRTIVLAAGAEMETSIRLEAQRTRQRRIPSDPGTTIERIGFDTGSRE